MEGREPAQRAKARMPRLLGVWVTRLAVALSLVTGLLIFGTALAAPADVRVHWEPIQTKASPTPSGISKVYYVLCDDSNNPVPEVGALDAAGAVTVADRGAWNAAHGASDARDDLVAGYAARGYVIATDQDDAYWAYEGNAVFPAPIDSHGEPLYRQYTRVTASRRYYLEGIWVKRTEGAATFEPWTPPALTSANADPSNGYLSERGLWRLEASTTRSAGIAAAFTDEGGIEQTDTILDHEPKISVTNLGSIFPAMEYFAFTSCASLVESVLSFATSCLSLIDPNTLFTAEFDSAQWSEFLDVARSVSEKITLPYGTAILLAAFIMNLSKMAEERGRGGSDAMLGTVLMFLLAWTFMAHSLEVFAGIYWLGKNLAVGVDIALTGKVGTFAAATSTIAYSFHEAMSKVTYENWMLGILFVVLALLTAVSCFTCALKIMSFAFLRMAEIYLRAAFAGIPLAYLSFRDGRHAALNYVKRYLAVVAEGAILIVALMLGIKLMATAPLYFNIAVEGDPLKQVLVSVFPALITMGCLSAIIDKTGQVAADLVNTHPSH